MVAGMHTGSADVAVTVGNAAGGQRCAVTAVLAPRGARKGERASLLTVARTVLPGASREPAPSPRSGLRGIRCQNCPSLDC